jgi:methanogenic corrinoid protein MtbC1
MEHLVNELIGCMVDLQIEKFEAILQEHLAEKGVVNTIKMLLFRFLDKTGILWQAGRINPAHEHIVTNIIRQKLIAAIENLPPATPAKPTMMLLLPEGQFHELGLLFVNYLLKQKGLPVIYLGANVPLKDAEYVARIKKPEYLYLHLTTLSGKPDFKKFISTLSTNLPECSLLLSGSSTSGSKDVFSSNVTVLESLQDVVAYISRL